jgi:hypothetical protein
MRRISRSLAILILLATVARGETISDLPKDLVRTTLVGVSWVKFSKVDVARFQKVAEYMKFPEVSHFQLRHELSGRKYQACAAAGAEVTYGLSYGNGARVLAFHLSEGGNVNRLLEQFPNFEQSPWPATRSGRWVFLQRTQEAPDGDVSPIRMRALTEAHRHFDDCGEIEFGMSFPYTEKANYSAIWIDHEQGSMNRLTSFSDEETSLKVLASLKDAMEQSLARTTPGKMKSPEIKRTGRTIHISYGLESISPFLPMMGVPHDSVGDASRLVSKTGWLRQLHLDTEACVLRAAVLVSSHFRNGGDFSIIRIKHSDKDATREEPFIDPRSLTTTTLADDQRQIEINFTAGRICLDPRTKDLAVHEDRRFGNSVAYFKYSPQFGWSKISSEADIGRFTLDFKLAHEPRDDVQFLKMRKRAPKR